MDNDDEQIGRLLNRREALSILGATGAAFLAGAPAAEAEPAPFRLPACIVRPQQIEGPYFVDTGLNRSDIRSDPTDGTSSAGVALRLDFQVSRLSQNACTPMEGVMVDLWQCDAMGVYSGVEDILYGEFDTRGKQFLRGHQLSDAAGLASFTTIYPGWYTGRAVHLHFKIRTDPSEESGYDFTSQLYFDDALSDRIFATAPYSEHEGDRVRSPDDRSFRSGGAQLLLNVEETADGLRALFDIGLQID